MKTIIFNLRSSQSKEQLEAHINAICDLSCLKLAEASHIISTDIGSINLIDIASNTAVQQYLESKVDKDKLNILIQCSIHAKYLLAATTGDLQQMSAIEAQLGEDLQSKLHADFPEIYEAAAVKGLVDVMAHLEAIIPTEQLQNILFDNGYYTIYHQAAKNGHLHAMQHLETIIDPNHRNNMIAARMHSIAPVFATQKGLDVFKHMEAQYLAAPQAFSKRTLISLYSTAYDAVAQSDNKELIEHLKIQLAQIAPDRLKTLISKNAYIQYQTAAERGDITQMKSLEAAAPGQVQDKISNNFYLAYRLAAANGHIDAMMHLEATILPDKLDEMRQAQDCHRYNSDANPLAPAYGAYRQATINGHVHVMLYLKNFILPNTLQEIIAYKGYELYISANTNGKLKAVQQLEAEVSTDKLQDMISAANYSAKYAPYWEALKFMHYSLVLHLESVIAPDKLQEMMKANDTQIYLLHGNSSALTSTVLQANFGTITIGRVLRQIQPLEQNSQLLKIAEKPVIKQYIAIEKRCLATKLPLSGFYDLIAYNFEFRRLSFNLVSKANFNLACPNTTFILPDEVTLKILGYVLNANGVDPADMQILASTCSYTQQTIDFSQPPLIKFGTNIVGSLEQQQAAWVQKQQSNSSNVSTLGQ